MFVLTDDELKVARQWMLGDRFRQRGPAPQLADAEVMTMECVSEMLGMDCAEQIFAYFTHHWSHFFPALARINRTTFIRQAANLWHLKEQIWRRLVHEVAPADDWLHIIDSMPVPVCRFARAPFCEEPVGRPGPRPGLWHLTVGFTERCWLIHWRSSSMYGREMHHRNSNS